MQVQCKKLLIRGDSTLAIGMAGGTYKAGKPYFWHLVKRIKAMARKLPWEVYWE